MQETTTQLDKLLSSPVKFGIMAQIIADGGEVAFVDVGRKQKTMIGSYGALSSHNKGLEREGYITLRKTFISNKARTMLVATDKGKERFARRCAALKAVAQLEAAE